MKLLIATAFLSLTFMACNSPATHEDAHSHTTDAQAAAQLPENSTNVKAGEFSMSPLVNAYLDLKNNLAKDDSKAAAEAGKTLSAILKSVDMNSIPADKHKEYMDITDNVKENAEHIADNTSNIGHQREHFASLSNDMSDLIAMFGTSQKLYQDHCPMYNNGKGADWISETKEIKNPYYGAEMYTCGSMKKEF